MQTGLQNQIVLSQRGVVAAQLTRRPELTLHALQCHAGQRCQKMHRYPDYGCGLSCPTYGRIVIIGADQNDG